MYIKLFSDKKEKRSDVRKVVVELSEDIQYQISVNKFGELVVQKQNFGQGESSIILKPSVSNEIRLS